MGRFIVAAAVAAGAAEAAFTSTRISPTSIKPRPRLTNKARRRNDIWMNLLSETDKMKKAMYEKFRVPF